MKKKGFTLIELLVVLIILGLIVSITTPIVLKTVGNAKEAANKRSVDGYGKAIEVAIADKLLETGEIPNSLEGLNIQYQGNEVSCEESILYEDGHVYLTKCKVNGKEVKDSSTEDGYYHYGNKGGEEPTPPGPTPPEEEYQAFNVGDKIIYKGEEYYTIEGTSKKKDYVTLLKVEPLKSDDIREIIQGTEVADKVRLDGEYAQVGFLTKDNCVSAGDISGCSNDYSQSTIKQVVDVWANSKLELNDLKEIEGYKARLLTLKDLTTNLGYEQPTAQISYITPSPENTPSWISSFYEITYWTMSPFSEEIYRAWNVDLGGNLNSASVGYDGGIRPVINLLKEKIESYEPEPEPEPPTPEIEPDPEEEDEEEEKYEEYYQGQEIEYNGNKYYVAKDSGKKRSYVTLLKKESLTISELSEYTEVEETQGEYGLISYSKDNSTNSYKNSSIKEVVDRWTENNTIEEDLKSVSGYKSRILSYTELVEDLGYNRATHNEGYFDNDSEYTPSFIKDKGYSYLTMSGIEGTAKGVWRVNSQGQLTSISNGNPFSDMTEDTTYFLDKEDWGYNDAYCYYWSDKNQSMIDWPGIQSTYKGSYNGGYVHACEVPTDAQYIIFSKGERQTEDLLLNRKQYYDNVSREWSNIPTEEMSTKGTVRPVINLLKEKIPEPEPEPEIEYRIGDQVTYKGENYYVIENSLESQDYITLLKGNPLTEKEVKLYGEYKDTVNGYGTSNYSNNSSDYNTSIVKQTVDGWSEARFRNDELKEVNGYKSRLLSHDDLINNLGYINSLNTSETYPGGNGETPDFIYNINVGYWTMSQYGDVDNWVWVVYNDGILHDTNIDGCCALNDYKGGTIRPVINLKKSALSNDPGPDPEPEGNYREYQIGDRVIYNGINYYVVENSNEFKSSLTLLKAEALTTEEISNYTSEYTDNDGYGIVKYKIDNSTNDYNNSDAKTIVDVWANNNTNTEDLVVDTNGYTSRLLTYQELLENFKFNQGTWGEGYYTGNPEYTPEYIMDAGYDYLTMSGVENSNVYAWYVNEYGQLASNGGGNYEWPYKFENEEKVYFVDYEGKWGYGNPYCHYWSNSGEGGTDWPGVEMTYEGYHNNGYVYSCNVPSWADKIIFNKNGQQTDDLDIQRYSYYSNENNEWTYKGQSTLYSPTGAIRPVINVSKDKVEAEPWEAPTYEEYKVGDTITYNGELYYTIAPSSSTQDYVTLLKAEPLKSDDIRDIISGTEIESKVRLDDTYAQYAQMAYLTKDDCVSAGDISGCSNDYSQSIIKQVVDVWANNKLTSTDLKDVNGYKARLIQFQEMVDNLGYELDSMGTSMVPNPESTPRWVYAPNHEYWYWTMTPVEDDVSRAWDVDVDGSLYRCIVNNSSDAVRPVINLLKSSI